MNERDDDAEQDERDDDAEQDEQDDHVEQCAWCLGSLEFGWCTHDGDCVCASCRKG